MTKRIEDLDASHDRARFDCGTEALNRFLQQVARQHSERGISRTWVMVEEGATEPKPVLGFFALAACEIESDQLSPELAKKLPRRIPAARLGRLAVARNAQGQGLGAALLIAAFKKVLLAAESLGIAALFVDAKDEHAANFYRHFGFLSLPSNPFTLFLMRSDVAKAVAAFDDQN